MKKYAMILIISAGILWLIPLMFTIWAAFCPAEYVTSPAFAFHITGDNILKALEYAPFLRYTFNTTVLVMGVVTGQFIICSLAAYAFARFEFKGREIAFALVMIQLLITPEILIVQNYRTISFLHLTDTIRGIALPYIASAFGIFLLRQSFKTIPRDLEEAAIIDGCGRVGILLRIFIPLSKSTFLAYGLVSVSHHWNDFLWPLIITNSVRVRPLTVGLAIFAAPESGVDWSVLSAGTLIAVLPLLILFLAFQKRFTESFVITGMK